jgi:eukaryotic-like serine/threonine-protein kinase
MDAGERSELRGTILDGRYLVGDVLGIGGTAVVFEASRLGAESGPREVVIKTLRPSFVDHPDLVRRLRREAEVARNVPHSGIVAVLDEGMLPDGSPYLVLERVRGECLARLLRRVGSLPPRVVGAIAIRVAAILHAAHARGYVHRDVKPEHVVMDEDVDGTLRVRLLDFGVCAAETAPADEKQREVGRVFGTPSYVSPEQASGDPDVDARADVFGIGVTMFEALTGRLPFSASNVANLLRRIIREDAPRVGLLRQDVDLAWDAAIARAMARCPEDRFPTVRALARGLAPLVGDRRVAEQQLLAMLDAHSMPAEQIETRRDSAAAFAA